MRITKTKRLAKKGLIDNFLTLLFVLILLGIIFAGLFLLMASKMRNVKMTVASDLNIKEGLYTTRILLNDELSPEYNVYNLVIDTVNKGEYDLFKEKIIDAILEYYPSKKIEDKWLIIINNNCYIISNLGEISSQRTIQSGSQFGVGGGMSAQIGIDECEKGLIDKMPKVTVPNPDGENILVLFKPSSELDGKTKRVFGYRADQLKGIQMENLPDFSADGRTMAKIENIPNVICDASETSVGKICVADERIVQKLKELSVDKLQKDNMQLIITQAYRTYEIQKRLYNLNCGSGSCTVPTCNPDISICPHMQAGAIDINLITKDGVNLNKDAGNAGIMQVEDIMCQYGFVRWHKENWHFEYGTNAWDIAMEKRANGERACSY